MVVLLEKRNLTVLNIDFKPNFLEMNYTELLIVASYRLPQLNHSIVINKSAEGSFANAKGVRLPCRGIKSEPRLTSHLLPGKWKKMKQYTKYFIVNINK